MYIVYVYAHNSKLMCVCWTEATAPHSRARANNQNQTYEYVSGLWCVFGVCDASAFALAITSSTEFSLSVCAIPDMCI